MIPVELAQELEQNQAHLSKLVDIVMAQDKLQCNRDSLLFRDHAGIVMGLEKLLSLRVVLVEAKELFQELEQETRDELIEASQYNLHR